MKHSPKHVPSFALYGEARALDIDEHLHIEDIQSRSRRYLWEIAPHTHRALYQCLFVAAGPAEGSVDERHTDLSGPALVILPPACVHAFRFNAETRGHVLTLGAEVLFEDNEQSAQRSFEALFAVPHVLRLEPRSRLAGRLAPLFLRLVEEYRAPGARHSPVCLWLARSILWLIGEELRQRHELDDLEHRAHQCFTRFQMLLETHYLDHWAVGRYAQTLGLSEGRLNRLCRAQCERSAFELLQERLLREARRRLAYASLPVAQLARELGFRDAAYFCRFFRRHAGVAPSQFRRRQGGSNSSLR